MDSAFRIGTRMAMLYQGKIIAEGNPEKFKQSDQPGGAAILERQHRRSYPGRKQRCNCDEMKS